MVTINSKNLKHMLESMGEKQTYEHIREALESGDLKPLDFSIEDLAEACYGREFVKMCDPKNGSSSNATAIMEAVDSTAFANIAGQIVFTAFMEGFTHADFVASALVPTVTTRLSGEKIPGITRSEVDLPKDEIKEGMPYPMRGIGEEWINTPPTKKYGERVGLTKEAIFFDRTAMLVEQAGDLGQWMGIIKEKLLQATITGFGGGSTPTFAGGGKWKWKDTEYAVYNSTTVDFVSYFYKNLMTDVLTDYTDIDAALLLFGEQRNPSTKEPILMAPQLTLLVPPSLRSTAFAIANASEIRVTTGTTIQTNRTNELGSMLMPKESRYLFRSLVDNGEISEANARKYWFIGDFGKAFRWMENWPTTITQAPTNSELEFVNDIVMQWKSSMRGVPAVIAPQHVIRSTGAG